MSEETTSERKEEVLEQGLGRKLQVVIGLGVAIVLIAIGAAGYFYTEYKKVVSLQNPEMEFEATVAAIAKIYELPTTERPTLATVTDRDKLSGQDFFSLAENGDKVLLYQELKKAIIYRPSTGKIVNIAPINVTETAPAEAPEVTPAEEKTETEIPKEGEAEVPSSARIALLNGTEKKGVTQKYEDRILAKYNTDVTIQEKATAEKNDYETTVVVDLSGKFSDIAKELAEEYGAKSAVSEMPEGEMQPDADIVIIYGKSHL